MLTSVQLDDEVSFDATEVGDVRSDRVLPAKFAAKSLRSRNYCQAASASITRGEATCTPGQRNTRDRMILDITPNTGRPGTMRDFDHERMEVYQRALVFICCANAIREKLCTGRSSLADQLDRASISIALNIAEGAGEFAKREKARFYRIARRSATECAAILDVTRALGLAEEADVREAREQLRVIVAMLVVLGKWVEKKAP